MNKFIDTEKIKSDLLTFTIQEVEKFLLENKNLEFYAFAYDCNSEYAEVNLCFNTELDLKKTLEYYQTGEFSKYYQSENDIKDLKFNPGDWEYQCFETTNVLTEEQLAKIYNDLPDDDYKSWNEFIENLTKLFCECLIDFTRTETYKKIPKTNDFLTFCIDHDEDFEDAIERLKTVKSNYASR